MPARSLRLLAALGATSALLLTGCASAAGGEKTTISFRLWDDSVAEAYEASFAEFEKQNPGIEVETNIVEWEDYWTDLRTDIADESMDDVFWLNNAAFATYADSGNLIDVTRAVGASAADGWQASVVEQFTRDETLWAVPQLYDAGIGLYYNMDLLDAAGVDPAQLDDLTWSPDPAADTFLPLAKQLTLDTAGVNAATEGFNGTPAQFGTNFGYDLQAILLPYIGSNGGVYQEEDDFAFADPRSVESVTYIVEAINSAKIAPSAEQTNADGEYSKQQFIDGKMAMFQSGVYSLKDIAESAEFSWGVAPIPAGPDGRVSVTNGIAAAGNAQTEHPDAVKKLLKWLGSEQGNAPLGETGSAIPAVTSAQSSFVDYWTERDVDVSPFFAVVEDGAQIIEPPRGAHFVDGLEAYDPIFREVFAGKIGVAEGLKRAQDAANAAITS